MLTFSLHAAAGTGQLVVSPSTINFGTVSVGSSQSQSVTLTNSGGPKITVTQANLSGTGFTLGGLNYPLTLAGGQSVTCWITFSPTSAGIDNGTVSITFTTQSNGKKTYSSSSSSSVTVTLSGTAVSSGQLGASPSSLNFSNVQVGSSQTVTETLSNSGGGSVTISGANVIGSGFSTSGLTLPFTLAVGQSVLLNVTFYAGSAGSVTGNLAISSNASNPTLNVPLSGTTVTPSQLSANPTSLNFGTVATGSSRTLAERLTNSGGSTLTISQIAPSGTGFSISGVNPPVTLYPAQSVTFNVTFAPQVGGSVSGNLAISSNGSNPNLSIPLTGTGSVPGQLAITPSTIDFGNVVVGTTKNQAATLTASNGPVTVSSATVTQSEFSLSGLTLPVTIPAGNSLSFSVIFSPQATGTASGSFNFLSNASNTPTAQSVTGSGTSAPQHSVSLTWNASTSSNVVGYNVYRGTVSGGPYTRINSSLETSTSDTDNTVQGGQTYYYVVTAVDSTGAESVYSNQTTAVIPYP
jgi:Abnormal spindle-like microcephaly-assoc'd, ASPM-SPD-2-Hydin